MRKAIVKQAKTELPSDTVQLRHTGVTGRELNRFFGLFRWSSGDCAQVYASIVTHFLD